VLAASQTTAFTHFRDIDSFGEAVPTCINKDDTFHMRRLHSPASHFELTSLGDQSLGNVNIVGVLFRRSERNGDAILRCCSLNTLHRKIVDPQRVLDIFDSEIESTGRDQIQAGIEESSTRELLQAWRLFLQPP